MSWSRSATGKRAPIRRAERYDRRKVTCPGCGKPGTLIVGEGLHPYVEHCYDQEIRAGGQSNCWLARDHATVLEVLARRSGVA